LEKFKQTFDPLLILKRKLKGKQRFSIKDKSCWRATKSNS